MKMIKPHVELLTQQYDKLSSDYREWLDLRSQISHRTS